MSFKIVGMSRSHAEMFILQVLTSILGFVLCMERIVAAVQVFKGNTVFNLCFLEGK